MGLTVPPFLCEDSTPAGASIDRSQSLDYPRRMGANECKRSVHYLAQVGGSCFHGEFTPRRTQGLDMACVDNTEPLQEFN